MQLNFSPGLKQNAKQNWFKWSIQEFDENEKKFPYLCELLTDDKVPLVPYFDWDMRMIKADGSEWLLPTDDEVLKTAEILAQNLRQRLNDGEVLIAYRKTAEVSNIKVKAKSSLRFFAIHCSSTMKYMKDIAKSITLKTIDSNALPGCVREYFANEETLFDVTIYNKNRIMNCVGKCKSNDDLRLLEPLLPCQIYKMSDFLIQNVREDAQFIDEVVNDVILQDLKQMTLNNADKKAIPSISLPILSNEFLPLLGPEMTKALVWKHTQNDQSHKLEPKTKWCTICQREHSASQFCVYVNNNTVTKHCGSAGSIVVPKREAKRIIDQFNRVVLQVIDEGTSAVQELQTELWDRGRNENLRRERGTGDVLCPYVTSNGTILSYAYVPYMKCEEFIESVLWDHPRYSSQATNLRQLKELMQTFNKPDFPFIAVDLNFYGFVNGVLHIRTLTFTPAQEFHDDIVCRKFLPQSLDIDNIHHAAFDRLIDYQMNMDVKEFLMMSIGRTFFRTNEIDQWTYMVYLYGESGTGKSRIIDLLKLLHRNGAVETISRGYQMEFGLSKLAKADLFVIDETPRNIKDVFPQESFTAAVTGGLLEMGGKHMNSYTDAFTTPMVWSGNYVLNYYDCGQISRRVVVVPFPNVVLSNDRDTNLQKQLESEAPAILYACLAKYKIFVEEYTVDGTDIWTIAPVELVQQKDEDRAERDPLFRFLSDAKHVTFVEGASTPLADVKVAFEAYIGKKITKKLSAGTFTQVDERWKVTRPHVCRMCGGKFSLRPRCCEKAVRSAHAPGRECVANFVLLNKTQNC